ncbi:MAG: hypothetical protein RL364_357 [Pseudomonadota bacterium]|jgi:TRAP-type C4-dicarboxylate transport system permease small subunit
MPDPCGRAIPPSGTAAQAGTAFVLQDTVLKKLLEWFCGLLCGVALFAIMTLTFFDVSGRKFLSQSITGSLELTELLMVVVIFCALPLVTLRGEHVTFDSLDSFLPNTVKRKQTHAVNIICGSAMLALGYLMWHTGLDFESAGETTAQLGIMKYPFIKGMGVLCALCGLVHWSLIWSKEPQGHQAGEAA